MGGKLGEILQEKLVEKADSFHQGAHRTGRVSLDYKLREASHVHAKVIDLLTDLNRSLQEGTKRRTYILKGHVSLTIDSNIYHQS